MKPSFPSAVYVSALMNGYRVQPGLLLQYLNKIQIQFSYVPAKAIERLASNLDITESRIRGVIEFYSFLHTTPRGQYDILFSDSITDHMLGSRTLLQNLCTQLDVELGTPRSDGLVTIGTTSCTGFCDQGPALLVNGQVITLLDNRRIKKIAGLVEAGTSISKWPAEFFQVNDNIRRHDLLLNDNKSNGSAIQTLLENGAETTLKELDHSGLRGRGGAGFKTAMKWQFCREAQRNQHYVVCNADEGEPGTFKDRILLDSYADEVIEGMTLCAGIIAAQQGYIYLRGEYFYLLEPLEAILKKRRQSGLLGKDILGKTGFDFDIEIHLGAGAYICGEESALIESLEGKRGIPRKRPPFPVTHGFRNQPTVVNNVETFFAAAKIAANGSNWFRSAGTEQSTGTKLLSISGDCAQPGIYEYPFGVSIR